jgi:hypothetical protein
MDHGCEAVVGLVCAQRDALEFLERGCLEITTLALRSLRSAMLALLSNALSATSASKANPSTSGGTPTVSIRVLRRQATEFSPLFPPKREKMG